MEVILLLRIRVAALGHSHLEKKIVFVNFGNNSWKSASLFPPQKKTKKKF